MGFKIERICVEKGGTCEQIDFFTKTPEASLVTALNT